MTALYLAACLVGALLGLAFFVWGKRVGARQALERAKRDPLASALARSVLLREHAAAERERIRETGRKLAPELDTPTPLEFSLDGEPLTPLPFTAPPDGVTRDGLAAAVAEGRRRRAAAEMIARRENPVHAARKGTHR